MNTQNLLELRTLRLQEKAIKARILEISDAAETEAVAILAAKGLDRGEFTVDDHHFQLQRTDVIDMSDYRRYKDADAVRWRQKKAEQDQSKKYSAALTKEMKAIIDSFTALHPDWEPDGIQLIVKVID